MLSGVTGVDCEMEIEFVNTVSMSQSVRLDCASYNVSYRVYVLCSVHSGSLVASWATDQQVVRSILNLGCDPETRVINP